MLPQVGIAGAIIDQAVHPNAAAIVLDTAKSHEIMSLLSSLNKDHGMTIVLVTHDEEIAAYARRHIRFRDGRIESDDGTPAP